MMYKEVLVRTGLKSTKHRILLMEILDSADEPMTVEEIFLYMKQKDTAISLSTVYRAMEALVKKDLAIKTSRLDDNRARYEYNRKIHKHHLVCTQCSKMVSVEGCPVEEYIKTLGKETGFELTGHRLEIYGICNACKAQ